MLKRYQVLINDWLADYIKLLSKKYDASFSEVVRLSLCMEYAYTISLSYPKYKTKINHKKTLNQLKKLMRTKKFLEGHHEVISRTYFEARKAIEFASKEESKRRNNSRIL